MHTDLVFLFKRERKIVFYDVNSLAMPDITLSYKVVLKEECYSESMYHCRIIPVKHLVLTSISYTSIIKEIVGIPYILH
jgi:hypothetical protein